MPLFSHFFLAPILHLICSWTTQTHFLPFSSYWLIQFTCEMYSMWQMLQRFCLMVKLMYQILEKVAKLFTITILLLNVFLSFKYEKMCIFEGQVSSKHKQIWAFLRPLKDSAICLKYNNSIDSLFLFGNHHFFSTTEIIPNHRNAVRSCINTASRYFTNVLNTHKRSRRLLQGMKNCVWKICQ